MFGISKRSSMQTYGTENTTPNVPSKVKKSRTLKQSLASMPEPTDLEEYDDSIERANRNLNRIMEEATKYTSPGTPERRKSVVSSAGLTNVQIAEHYSNCLKLSAENKINLKNAFDLHLIDLMSSMLKKDEANFQTASSTIDAGAKIYAYRVDSLYRETYKIYGGLGRPDKAPEFDDDENIDSESRHLEREKEQPVATICKRKRRKAVKGSCIESNDKLLNAVSNESKLQCDELFEHVKSLFEEGNASGLFLNTLSTVDDSNQLILHTYCELLDHDSMEVPQPPTADQEYMFAKSMLEKVVSAFQSDFVSTCYPIANFDFLHWDSKELDETSINDVQQGNKSVNQENEFVANVESNSVGSIADDMAELDERDRTILDDSINIEPESYTASTSSKKFKVLEAALSTKDLEYSYFDSNAIQTWMGPNHWKVKPLPTLTDNQEHLSASQKQRLKKTKLTSKKDEIEKKRKTASNQRINWNEKLNFAKLLKANPRVSTVLPDVQLAKLKQADLTIDPDADSQEPLNYNLLFLRPDMKIGAKSESAIVVEPSLNNESRNFESQFCHESSQMEDGIENEHDQDAADEIAFDDVPDDDADYSCVPIASSNQPVVEDGVLNDENLLEQPYKVNKIDINYAKHAKRIDVKKLKSAMWKILTTDDSNDQTSKTKRQSNDHVNKTFSTMCEALPTFVSSQTMQNLSKHTAFTILLHMCNEKNLELCSMAEFDDIVIKHD